MTGEVSYLNNDLLSHFLNTLPYPEIITSGLVFKVNEWHQVDSKKGEWGTFDGWQGSKCDYKGRFFKLFCCVNRPTRYLVQKLFGAKLLDQTAVTNYTFFSRIKTHPLIAARNKDGGPFVVSNLHYLTIFPIWIDAKKCVSFGKFSDSWIFFAYTLVSSCDMWRASQKMETERKNIHKIMFLLIICITSKGGVQVSIAPLTRKSEEKRYWLVCMKMTL